MAVNMTTKVKGKILKNSPCGQDFFDGKPHKKLASVIAEYIKCSKEGSIIGIDGDWGSGKSNLIEMVKSQIDKDKGNKYYFFMYDAWEHQTDLLRRTLLEEIISYILKVQKDGKPISRNEKLQGELDNLLGTKRITKAKTIPELGISLVRELLFIAIVFIAVSVTHLINSEWLESTWFKPLIYVVLSVSVFIWAFFANRRLKHVLKDVYGEEISFMRSILNLFLIGKDKIKEDTTYETISERESTSREFKELFSEIDADLKGNNKVLIIVIDDMDRLPKNKVREIWAVILSFFIEAKYSNIHIIVPFDRGHLRNAFHNENIGTNDDADEEGETIIYADEFINKTFSIVYNVSPPIMTGWMRYFTLKWRDAFGKSAHLDKSVVQVYDVLIKEHTPRRIVAFINQFVTIRNTCEQEIEDKYIALYIAGMREIKYNPLVELVKPSYLGSLAYLYENDLKMPMYISALHYQLPVRKAMDAIYLDEATKELNSNKIHFLDMLKGDQKYLIVQHAIEYVTNVENATFALNSIFVSHTIHSANKIWNDLYKKSIALKYVYTKYDKSHLILLSHITEKEKLYKNLIKQYHKNIVENNDNFDVMNYVEGIDCLNKEYADENFMALFKTEIRPEDFVLLIKVRKENFKHYGLTVNDANLDTYFLNMSNEEIATIKIYPYIGKQHRIPNYADKVKSVFRNLQPSSISLLKPLLERMKEIETCPYKITKYWNTTKIYSIAKAVKEENKAFPDIIAITISLGNLQGNPSVRSLYTKTLTSTDEKLVKAIASVIESYMDYGSILTSLPIHRERKLVAAVARELTINGSDSSRMNVKDTLTAFDKILEASEITSDELINRLNEWDVGDIKVEDVKAFPIKLFEELPKFKNRLSKHIFDLTKSYLGLIQENEWRSSMLTTNSKIFEIYKAYHPIRLTKFINAFNQLMVNYAEGKSNNSIPKGRVNEVVNICNDLNVDVKQLFENISKLIVDRPTIDRDRVKYFCDWLLSYGKLHEIPNSLGKIFKREFLDDNEIVQILIRNANEIKIMVENADDPSLFINKMKSLGVIKYKNNQSFQNLCATLEI